VNVHTKNEKAIINANEICQIHGILSGFEVEDTGHERCNKKKVALNGHKQARQVLPMGKKKSDRAITMFPPFALYFPCLTTEDA